MNRLLKFALAASTVATLAACSATSTPKAPSAEPISLANTSWSLDIPVDAECEVAPMIEFTDKTFAGDLGCNRAMGAYTLEGNQLKFDDKMAVTRRMCAPQYMKVEEQMLNALNNVRSIIKTETGMTFLDAEGKELAKFIPEQTGACK